MLNVELHQADLRRTILPIGDPDVSGQHEQNPFEVARSANEDGVSNNEERKTPPEEIRESEIVDNNRGLQVLHSEIVEPGRLMQEPPMPQANGEGSQMRVDPESSENEPAGQFDELEGGKLREDI